MQAFEYQLPAPRGTQAFETRLAISGSNEVLAIVRDITERKKVVDTLAQSEARLLAEMQTVLAITRALVSEIDLNNLLEFIMTQAEHLMNAGGVAVLLLRDDGEQLEVAAPGESWLQVQPGALLPVKGSLAEPAITGQKVQFSNHASDDDRTTSIRAFLQPVEIQALLCAPLIAQGKALGVLLVWSGHKQSFTANDGRLLGLFADEAALALHNAHLHAQNRQLAIEQERHRLARDLHDSVTQSLYSIGLAAQASLRLLGQDSDSTARKPIKHIQKLSQIALAEMRERLYDLHPTTLTDKGLVEAIDQYCNMLSEQHAMAIEFTADFEPPFSMYQRENLYYITREALWNAVKYAGATRVKVALIREKTHTILSITDEGVGFASSAFAPAETGGLRGMEERARLLGGTLELQSRPGQGTRLVVQLPVKPH
jgi:signal transduction histidine kinase